MGGIEACGGGNGSIKGGNSRVKHRDPPSQHPGVAVTGSL